MSCFDSWRFISLVRLETTRPKPPTSVSALSLEMVRAWGTLPMREFLERWIPAHKEASAKRDWDKFWPAFFSAWFMEFPETDIVIPGQPLIRKVSVLSLHFECNDLPVTCRD